MTNAKVSVVDVNGCWVVVVVVFFIADTECKAPQSAQLAAVNPI